MEKMLPWNMKSQTALTKTNTSALSELRTVNMSTFPPMYVSFCSDHFNRWYPDQVDANELTKFYSAYAILLKSSLSLTLRKRDKKKEKTKQDQILKRKKRMTEPVVVDGPKRGAGRRKRQRQIKATIKQAEAQKKFKEREEKRKVENLSA